jgi:hypothetical protein
MIQINLVESWGLDFIFTIVWETKRREMERKDDGGISVRITIMKKILL